MLSNSSLSENYNRIREYKQIFFILLKMKYSTCLFNVIYENKFKIIYIFSFHGEWLTIYRPFKWENILNF